MVSTRGRGRGKTDTNEAEGAENGGEGGNKPEYEESRAQRIKENMERMKRLGIFELSKQLKPHSSKPPRKTKLVSAPSNDPPRRSSRLKEMPTVSYMEKKTPKVTEVKNVEIHIPEGENPEIYTEEHEKLLGDSEAVWELLVDGFDEEGQRMYDPIDGKSCHQCRQKTLGQHTKCSTCDLVAGQFCGDCLYMRYGENVTEVNQKPDWVCPVCRGICNCSRCRRSKGWEPTGSIYRKVLKCGYKSVAHYLIHTRRGQATGVASPISIDKSDSVDFDQNEDPSDALPQPDAEKKITVKDNEEMDSDEDYRQDEYEEDDEGVEDDEGSVDDVDDDGE